MISLRQEKNFYHRRQRFYRATLIDRFKEENIRPFIGSDKIGKALKKQFLQKNVEWKKLDLLNYEQTEKTLTQLKPTIINSSCRSDAAR